MSAEEGTRSPPLVLIPALVFPSSSVWFFLSPPGSHDSFTYWVDAHAPVGPDQKIYVKYLATMFSVLAKKVMVKWSMTQVGYAFQISSLRFWVTLISRSAPFPQNLTFKEQLDAGIRYFDLRVSSKPGERGLEIFFIHGLFGHKVGKEERVRTAERRHARTADQKMYS